MLKWKIWSVQRKKGDSRWCQIVKSALLAKHWFWMLSSPEHLYKPGWCQIVSQWFYCFILIYSWWHDRIRRCFAFWRSVCSSEEMFRTFISWVAGLGTEILTWYHDRGQDILKDIFPNLFAAFRNQTCTIAKMSDSGNVPGWQHQV